MIKSHIFDISIDSEFLYSAQQTDGGDWSDEAENQSPDWVDQEQNDPDGVRHSIFLSERVPEPAGRTDMFLKKVATDEETHQLSDEITSDCVSK